MLTAAATRLLARVSRRPPAPASAAARAASTDGAPVDVDAELDAVHALFATAREDLEDASDDAGTTYFAASYDAAFHSTNAAVAAFEALCARLPADEAARVRRASGLKMEQLKAELGNLEPH